MLILGERDISSSTLFMNDTESSIEHSFNSLLSQPNSKLVKYSIDSVKENFDENKKQTLEYCALFLVLFFSGKYSQTSLKLTCEGFKALKFRKVFSQRF